MGANWWGLLWALALRDARAYYALLLAPVSRTLWLASQASKQAVARLKIERGPELLVASFFLPVASFVIFRDLGRGTR